MSTEIALKRKLSDFIAEYDFKKENIPNAVADFEQAGTNLRAASCISGTWGNTQIDTGHIYDRTLESSLLKSAWRHTYNYLQIDRLASAEDKKKFEQAMENPIPYTIENIRATFANFILDPRGNILRGLAEVFCSLDQAYKSHEKVKIGVKGLPKRIIMSGFGGYSSWGEDRLRDVLNALAAYQGKPLVEYAEINAIRKNGDALKAERGVYLRRFANGNGHLFFEPDTLNDINRALAEYYGDVLPDHSGEKPTEKQASTAVSKDLQYYPTPIAVVEKVVSELYIQKGDRILEPSCGCGRFMDALRKEGASVLGIEFDAARANEARAKGHNVLIANFLETVPTGDFDRVVMNPPFYGKHYAKHVEHALKFLNNKGTLTAILPATARYDHGLLKGEWHDLPVGSFSESGTNVNTTVLTIRKREP